MNITVLLITLITIGLLALLAFPRLRTFLRRALEHPRERIRNLLRARATSHLVCPSPGGWAGATWGLLLCGLMAWLCLAPSAARAQVTQGNITNIVANLPGIINVATVSNTTAAFTVRQGHGASLTWRFNQSAGNSNNVVYMAPRGDGTNVATNSVWIWTMAGNSTTDYTYLTNWSAAQLAGIRDILIFAQSNSGGTGIVTNKAVVVNVENN